MAGSGWSWAALTRSIGWTCRKGGAARAARARARRAGRGLGPGRPPRLDRLDVPKGGSCLGDPRPRLLPEPLGDFGDALLGRGDLAALPAPRVGAAGGGRRSR